MIESMLLRSCFLLSKKTDRRPRLKSHNQQRDELCQYAGSPHDLRLLPKCAYAMSLREEHQALPAFVYEGVVHKEKSHGLHVISSPNQTTLLTSSDSQASPGIRDRPVRSRGSQVKFDRQHVGKATGLSIAIVRKNFLTHRNYFH